ncbi:hypothetical protein [Gilliamella sp. ESL0254]|uniref:hypothetical protein n=1 Tax=Gilliamella sp. ESL0254 TaxID=2705035 RepID=UPI0015804E1E|nr:hypothetical protein [Gilliamella sp. ESL0254]NUF26720.1 hypothetical protein [Gilliamella sp. ESL0254]
MASGIWHLACQTYALNLFQFHRSLNQIQFLLSSPKSFRVAKSATLSARLSPIPKLLSKTSLLSKSALVFALLLLLSYKQDTEALTVKTTNTIYGSAPYLTFDGGPTKVTDTDTFLAIELPDGRTITPSTNTSSSINPIRLPNGNFTFNDIHMVLPSGSDSISLNNLITQGKWGDDDGDGQGVNGVTASGSIDLIIKDKDGNTINRSDSLSICGAPYKVTLSSTGGNLVTQYGVPNRSTFGGGTAEYYITLSSPVICSVRPNLLLGGTTGIDSRDGPYRAGPSNIWNPDKGFLVQSTSSLSYDRNFPTTGSDGLYFDLDIGGIDGSQLSWSIYTSGDISATVIWTRPRSGSHQDPFMGTVQNDAWIRNKSRNVTRVTLNGPRASSSQINSNYPSSLRRPSLPQTFELVGRDRSGNEVKYGFVLRQWFVNRDVQMAHVSNQATWCNSLGYRMPRVSDLTNAKCGVDNSWFPCVNGIDGASPSSDGYYYQRHIGAGFFTEWGSMGYSSDAGFVDGVYWTSDATGSNQFFVSSGTGAVRSDSSGYYTVCTAP